MDVTRDWASEKTLTSQTIDLIELLGGAQGRSRTTDTRIFSPLLYQLSYLGLIEAADDAEVRSFREASPRKARGL